MNIESLREFCFTFSGVTEDCAFGDDILLLRVAGKIFVCIDLNRPDLFVAKADATLAEQMREEHTEIRPAWHWNKKYWNEILLTGSLTDDFIRELVSHSYSEVVKKLPRKVRESLLA